MPPRPSLLINASPAFSPDPSGVARYIINMIRALEKQLSPFAHRYHYQKWNHRAFPALDRELRIHRGPSLVRFFRPFIRKVRQVSGYRLVPPFDLYWEPNHIFEPSIRARRRLLTVHDLSTRRFPEWHPKKRLARFEADFLAAVHAADHIITVTSAVKKELQDLEGVAPERISVIPNGIDHGLFHPGTGHTPESLPGSVHPGNFILFVGTIEPRKNLTLLLDAHQSLPEPLQRKFPVVIAGGEGWQSDHLLQRVADNPFCIRAGFVRDDALPELYRAASVLVYPSHYEGFGLPPLEAMACGCPVIASSIPAHREVLGEAALFCDPADPKGLAESIGHLLGCPSLQNNYRERGLRQAAAFRWERAAGELIELFRKLHPVPASS